MYGRLRTKVLNFHPAMDFLENNYKTQTISLVRKRFKLIWFLTIRVQKTQFLGCYFIILPAAEMARSPT